MKKIHSVEMFYIVRKTKYYEEMFYFVKPEIIPINIW